MLVDSLHLWIPFNPRTKHIRTHFKKVFKNHPQIYPFKVIITQYGVCVQGSLAKYIADNNYTRFKFDEMGVAIGIILNALDIEWKEAFISRIDFFLDILLRREPHLYFPCFKSIHRERFQFLGTGTMQHKRIGTDSIHSIYSITNDRVGVVYDKGAETNGLLKGNVGRFEIRALGHHKHHLGLDSPFTLDVLINKESSTDTLFNYVESVYSNTNFMDMIYDERDLTKLERSFIEVRSMFGNEKFLEFSESQIGKARTGRERTELRKVRDVCLSMNLNSEFTNELKGKISKKIREEKTQILVDRKNSLRR